MAKRPKKQFVSKTEYEALDPAEREMYDAIPAEVHYLERTANLERALEEERHGRTTAESAFAPWQGLNMKLDDVKAALELKKNLSKMTPDDKVREQMDQLKHEINEAAASEKAALVAERDKLAGFLRKTVVDAALAKAIAKHGGNPLLLEPALRSQVDMFEDPKDGPVARVMDGDRPRISKRNTQAHMDADELVEGLSQDKNWAPAFNGHSAVGAGSPGSRQNRAQARVSIKNSDRGNARVMQEAFKAADDAGLPRTQIEVTDG